MKNQSKAKVIKMLNALPETISASATYLIKTDLNFPHVLTMGQFVTMYNRVDSKGVKMLMAHPRQRETEARLERAAAAGGHLSKFSSSHTEIVLGYFEGQLYIIDGNHRARLWNTSPEAERPTTVNLIVKYFDNDAEFTSVYYNYDSKAALETGRQKLYGYMSAAGYADKLQSKFVKAGKLLSAIKHLPGYLKGQEASLLAGWKREICALDKDLSRNDTFFHSGVVAGLLLSYRTEAISTVSAFVEEFQKLKVTRQNAKQFNLTLTPAQKVVDTLDVALKCTFGKNNEDTIRLKKILTQSALANYKAALSFAGTQSTTRKRLKKAA